MGIADLKVRFNQLALQVRMNAMTLLLRAYSLHSVWQKIIARHLHRTIEKADELIVIGFQEVFRVVQPLHDLKVRRFTSQSASEHTA